jgi:hypothetical protein
MSGTFEYTAELQLNDGSLVQIDLEERGWAEPERLANTRVFTLVPKNPGQHWPFLRVHIPEGAKPIFKSRNNVLMYAGKQLRVYAAGWFKDGESHWTWVFPNGSIEVETDEPTFLDIITHAINDAWRASLPEREGQAPSGPDSSDIEGEPWQNA